MLFFTAQEIQKQFYVSEDGKHYCFSLTAKRTYDSNCGMPKREMLDIMTSAIATAEQVRNRDFVRIVYVLAPSLPDAAPEVRTVRKKGSIRETTIYNKASDTVMTTTTLDSGTDSEYDPVTGTTRPKSSGL